MKNLPNENLRVEEHAHLTILKHLAYLTSWKVIPICISFQCSYFILIICVSPLSTWVEKLFLIHLYNAKVSSSMFEKVLNKCSLNAYWKKSNYFSIESLKNNATSHKKREKEEKIGLFLFISIQLTRRFAKSLLGEGILDFWGETFGSLDSQV